MTENLHGLIDRMIDLCAAGLLSVFGGTAAYLYRTVRDDTGFRFSHFFTNAFLAFFIGNMVGGFIPTTANYRDGLLMLAGFSTFPILGVLEHYGRKVILKYIDARLNTEMSMEKDFGNKKSPEKESTNTDPDKVQE